ncbi:DUF1499 domain-containing protein [Pleurocapsales cyanobacterium LEGE 10410]|nr:DUF1499 domain-containing protein [Pleurocapsales cyanobacterium LEGE 10410]
MVSRFLSIILGLIITVSSSLIYSVPALAIGIDNGYLEPCPSSPNCVISQRLLRRETTEPALTVGQDGDEDHEIEPIAYQGDRANARESLLKVLSVVPRTKVIEQTGNYIRSESTSRIFKFVDDVEFYLPEDENVIHVRSASRVGESDLGVNRRRIEQIRLAMQDLGV